jgi:hypothetical protein
MWAVKRFGSCFVDMRTHDAYAIDLCKVREFSVKRGSVSLDIRDGHMDIVTPATVKFSGLRGESYNVTINGEGKRYTKVELESGITDFRLFT